jgi:membrane protein YdbS with pleckstrin-like domain
LVPRWQGVGASVCWLLSETLILVLSQKFMSKEFKVHFPLRRFLGVLKGYILLVPFLYMVYCFWENEVWWQVFVGGVIMGVYVIFVQLFFLKNSVVLAFISKYSLKMWL